MSFFRNKEEKVAVWQWPNVPLWTWLAASIAARFLHGSFHTVASWIAFAAIVIWAALELYSGASPFRRVLGLIVLIGSLWAQLGKL